MAKSRMVCGNDPRAQLTEGDRKAVAAFEAFLASKKQLAEEIPVFAREITRERLRQLDKFGDQRHPDGTSGHNFARLADEARRSCQRATQNETLTWFHILREEFWEAMSETDPAKLRTELVQCAAVVQAWISDIDRRAEDGA